MSRFAIQLLSCFAILLSTSRLMGQTEDTTRRDYPEFKLLRADENYAFLRNGFTTNTFSERLKYLPLGVGNFLSVGGDFRSEFQWLRNEVWQEGNDDAALFLRVMLHSDVRLGEGFRIFSQLKSGHAIGRNGPPFFLNVDRLDLHQFFIGLTIDQSTIEIGRRELVYGSRRLISIREGTNVRQSFDGARYIWQKPNHRLDLLFYAYNPQRIGFFDNRLNTDQLLWGAYYVWNGPGESSANFDLYYLGIRHRFPRFEEGSQEEVRHSFGIRHWGSVGRLAYNNEAVLQTGSFGSGHINAWTISTELNYKLDDAAGLTPGIKAEIISGDSNPMDGNLQTFNALYPRGGYFGLLAVIGPANLVDVHPSLKFKLLSRFNLNIDWDFFWRHRTGDGIYFPSGRLNIPGSDSSERFIGHQAGLQIGTAINRHCEIEASYFYFFAGPFLNDVSDGANFSQFGTSFSYKF